MAILLNVVEHGKDVIIIILKSSNKSVCMVAMHYQLSFMISKLCFPTTLCDSP